MAYEVLPKYYDRFFSTAETERTAAGFLKLFKSAKNLTGDEIFLDLCCGTGSFTYFFERHFDVLGVDRSESALAVAESKRPAGSSALFIRADAKKLDLFGTVDLALCARDSVNHFKDEKELEAVFSRLGLFMNPGGVFIFDVNTLYKHKKILGDNTFYLEDEEASLVWNNRFDPVKKRTRIDIDIFVRRPDGLYKKESERFYERVFGDKALRLALKKAGFSVLNVLGEPGREKERKIFVAVKHEL